MFRRLKLLSLPLFTLVLAACSATMPHGESNRTMPWPSYEAAKQDYDQVIVGHSTHDDLKALRFTPDQNANVRLLNKLELVSRMMKDQPSMSRDDMPPALLNCLKTREGCLGYEINLRVSEEQRSGNFFADLLNFSRKTQNQGWAFNALFLLQDGRVTYKEWNGTPRIGE